MDTRTATVTTVVIFLMGLLIGSFVKPEHVVLHGQTTPAIGFAAVAGQKGGQDQTGPYEVVANWPKPLSQFS